MKFRARAAAFSVVLLALLALTSTSAREAGAASFTGSAHPVVVSGGQTTQHTLLIQGQSVSCNSVSFAGTLNGVSETLKITPTYGGGCKAFGFLEATVESNGCSYLLGVGSGSSDNYEGSTEIVCPAGQSITVKAATCTVHVPAQTPTTPKVDLEVDTGFPNKVLVTWKVEGIHSSATSGFLCPLTSKETDTTGKYTGSTLLSGNLGRSIDIGTPQPASFTAGSYPVAVEGAQTVEHKFTIQGQAIACKTTKLTGELTAASEDVTLTPEYKECSAGLINPTIDMNGCTYVVEVDSGSADDFSGSLRVACPEGKEITITAGPCRIDVPPQVPAKPGVHLDVETGSPNKVLLTSTVEGLHSKVTSEAPCALAGGSTDTTLKYTGSSRLAGAGGVLLDISQASKPATAGNFTANSYPVALAGGQATTHKLTIQGQSMTCTEAVFSAELLAQTELLDVTPVYSGCTAFGVAGSIVDMNGCEFRLDGGEGSEGFYIGSTEIVCPPGKVIAVTAKGCTVHIPAQTPTSNEVQYVNEPGGDVRVTWNVSGIHSTPTTGCPIAAKATDASGQYTGSTVLSDIGWASDIDVG